MNELGSAEKVQIGDWNLRLRIPDGSGPFPVILMLHGWTGDENSMWVFASRFPENAMLIAPRGPFPTPLGGFGWHAYKAKIWPWLDEFQPALKALDTLLTPENFPQANIGHLHLVGFSQGAALAFSFLLENAGRIASVASLSGFLPYGVDAIEIDESLAGIPIFIAHGSEDDLVPVDRARGAVAFLEAAGARVTYCEDEVGHKLSTNCFRGLESFFTKGLDHW